MTNAVIDECQTKFFMFHYFPSQFQFHSHVQEKKIIYTKFSICNIPFFNRSPIILTMKKTHVEKCSSTMFTSSLLIFEGLLFTQICLPLLDESKQFYNQKVQHFMTTIICLPFSTHSLIVSTTMSLRTIIQHVLFCLTFIFALLYLLQSQFHQSHVPQNTATR